MTTLTLELSSDLYERLYAESTRLEQPISKLVQTWLAERLTPVKLKNDREKLIEALKTANLLTEPDPEMKKRAEQCTVTLEEVRAMLDKSQGKPLSEIILEQRGPKN